MSLPNGPDFAPYAMLHGARRLAHPEVGPCFICEGRFLVEEALKDAHAGRLRMISLLATEKAVEAFRDRLPEGTTLLALPDPVLHALVGFPFHRGVLACVAEPPAPDMEALQAARRLLVLPRVDHVENLGLLMRSAAALGMDGLAMGGGPHPYERRAVRVSMGAAWRLPVWQVPDLQASIQDWRRHAPGEVVAAALVAHATDAQAWVPCTRTALVLGPEGPGLDPTWVDLADQVLHIPMARAMDSLNVAATGAILMWQLCRR